MCPRKINVLGKDFTVKFAESAAADNTSCLGRTVFKTQSIVVRNDQAPEYERDTVLHEVIHAVEDSMYLSLPERAIHLMATGLLQVLRANPKFVAYLMEKV